MVLHSFTVGPFQENTYLLVEDEEALLIDPGFSQPSEVNAFQQKLDEEQADLKAVVLTHAHVDHILGLHDVLQHYSVPVYLSVIDRYLWNNFAPQAKMFGFDADQFSFKPEKLPIQEKWTLGSFQFDVIHTPGHAPAHVSLYNAGEQILIVGDVLFKEGVGRTDLYKGDMELLKSTIREKLFALPDDTKVFSGHGPSTTIGYEKQHNPFVKLTAD
jgi:glyoxylase-like metal-dependent hydrolase (beta-lactamase superfamily II)